MKDADIIEDLRGKLSMVGGRHLYGVLGGYPALDRFARRLRQAKTVDGQSFPAPLSANHGILDAIPDGQFRALAGNEAKRPQAAAAEVGRAFEAFVRAHLQQDGLIVLAHLEMVFAYGVELSSLRTLSTDQQRIILLLAGHREGGRVVMFPQAGMGSYVLPTNLIAENHLWQLRADDAPGRMD